MQNKGTVPIDKYTPQTGDFVIFSNSHIGIVAGYDEETDSLYTYEGNKSDKVKAVIYKNASSYKKIVGYCGNGSGIVGCPDNVETYIMDDNGTTR